MAMALDHVCPECDEERTFRLAARTTLHLGRKTKWTCPECSYGFVQIDGIDTSASA